MQSHATLSKCVYGISCYGVRLCRDSGIASRTVSVRVYPLQHNSLWAGLLDVFMDIFSGVLNFASQ